MGRYLLSGLFLLAMTIATPAAAIQSFEFVARVDQANTLVPVNTSVSGTFSYDDTLSPTTTFSDPIFMTALYNNPSINLTLSFNGATFSSGGIAQVSHDVEGGALFIGAPDPSFAGGSFFSAIYVWDPLATFMSGTSLPAHFAALDQGPFADPNDDDGLMVPHGEFTYFDKAAQAGFTATILSILPQNGAIPEPATWIMLISGFGVVGMAMRKQKRRVPAVLA